MRSPQARTPSSVACTPTQDQNHHSSRIFVNYFQNVISRSPGHSTGQSQLGVLAHLWPPISEIQNVIIAPISMPSPHHHPGSRNHCNHQPQSTLSSCSWSSTTTKLARLCSTTYRTASGLFVVYIPAKQMFVVYIPAKKINVYIPANKCLSCISLQKNDCCVYPCKKCLLCISLQKND